MATGVSDLIIRYGRRGATLADFTPVPTRVLGRIHCFNSLCCDHRRDTPTDNYASICTGIRGTNDVVCEGTDVANGHSGSSLCLSFKITTEVEE